MSDNLFDRLFELFQSPGPVNWKLAREISRSVAGERLPIDPDLAEQYQSLALAAELRLTDMPGLGLPTSASIDPVDGPTWADENQQSFGYIIEPLAERFGTSGSTTPIGSLLGSLTPALLGMQAGTTVGTLSRRAMGQFDTGLPPLDHDRRYLVVPNVEEFAAENGLDDQQVRMWAVLHEVTFHTIMQVPWLRGHLTSIVKDFVSTIEMDPDRLAGGMTAIGSPEQLQEILGETPDVAALLGIEIDESRTAPIEALAAFIEGYGDHVVAGAARGLLPDHERIAAAAARRRTEDAAPVAGILDVSGAGMDRGRSAAAAAFCAEIDERWGTAALARVWEAPEHLPAIDELDDPVGWAARVLLTLGDLGFEE